MESIAIVGYGNVGWQLAEHFKACSLPLKSIYTSQSVEIKGINVQNAHAVITEDVVLICQPDERIESTLNRIANTKSVVLHTSGSKSIEALKRFENCGVLYPFQTLTKGRLLPISQIPFYTESGSEHANKVLIELAQKLGASAHEMNSEDRRNLHLTGVLVNNFGNQLFHQASKYLNQNGIENASLEPLIRETVAKYFDLGGMKAQTGPAKRNDYSTIKKHLEQLDGSNLKDLYQLFTQIIKTEFNEQ
ncbi:MAG: DUF2520 domain-containing protein [Bacteroidetes bacterium]|nr:DUF2520 domain-containing protein [Bacteroidota bacterium]